MYPFLPGHVTRPKECKKLYFIRLPKKSEFYPNPDVFPINIAYILPNSFIEVLSVPKNMKLLAVPLFELYDNTARYGPQLSAIPHLLSRYNFEMVDENDNIVAVTPGTPLPPGYTIPTRVLANGGSDDGQDTGMTGVEEGMRIESHQ